MQANGTHSLFTCPGYSPDYQAMGDCRNCGHIERSHNQMNALPPGNYTEHTATYAGCIVRLQRKTALIKSDGTGRVFAQFNDLDVGREAFGWHAFQDGDFINWKAVGGE